jgi:hypothetical protein
MVGSIVCKNTCNYFFDAEDIQEENQTKHYVLCGHDGWRQATPEPKTITAPHGDGIL